MPILRNISVEIHSQHGDPPLAEYLVSASDSSSRGAIVTNSTTASAYAHFQPGAQFWLVYAVLPPHHPVPAYFFARLSVGGRHVASWGFGARSEYKGKTMFALFEPGKEDAEGRGRLEKLVLAFASEPARGDDDALELRFFRSNGRRRVKREVGEFSGQDLSEIYSGGVDLARGGQVSKRQPREYFQYSLEDPVDRPYATFKYFFKTEAQLRELGLETYYDHTMSDTRSTESKDIKRKSVESTKSDRDSEIMSTLSQHAILAIEQESRRERDTQSDGTNQKGSAGRLSAAPSHVFLPPLEFSSPRSPKKASSSENWSSDRRGGDGDAAGDVEDKLQSFYGESPARRKMSTKIRDVFSQAIRRSIDGE